MITDYNECRKLTLENLRSIKDTCDTILRLYHKGNTNFLIEDIISIVDYCNIIAKDNYDVLATEY